MVGSVSKTRDKDKRMITSRTFYILNIQYVAPMYINKHIILCTSMYYRYLLLFTIYYSLLFRKKNYFIMSIVLLKKRISLNCSYSSTFLNIFENMRSILCSKYDFAFVFVLWNIINNQKIRIFGSISW